MKKIFISLTALAVISVGCAKDNDKTAEENTTQAMRDPNLQGKTFWGACTLVPETAAGTGLLTGHFIKAARTAYQFDGAQSIRHTRYFENKDCTGESAVTFREMGGFNIQTDKKTSDDATFVDFNYDTLKVRVDSATGAEVANKIGLCKAGNWVAGEERTVTGASSDVTCLDRVQPRVELNVYRVESSSLFLGSQSARDTQSRPTVLDRTTQQYVSN